MESLRDHKVLNEVDEIQKGPLVKSRDLRVNGRRVLPLVQTASAGDYSPTIRSSKRIVLT